MLRASLVLVLGACCAYAQIPATQLQVSGRILKSGSLSLPPSAGIFVLESVTSYVSTQVRVRVRPLSGSAITMPMIARPVISPTVVVCRDICLVVILKNKEAARMSQAASFEKT
jgi:hypothetical protein